MSPAVRNCLLVALLGTALLVVIGAAAPATTPEAPKPDKAFLTQNLELTTLKSQQTELASKVELLALQGLQAGGEVGERIVDLPEDSGTYWLSVFYRDQYQDPASRRLAAYMASEPRLQSLAAMMRTNVYTAGHPMYEQRYSNLISGQGDSGLPAVVVQKPNGALVYKASGANIPDSAEALAEEIRESLRRSAPNWDCRPYDPNCRPKPKPQPAPLPPAPAPAPLPDIRPVDPVAPSEDVINWGAGVLLVAVALGGGAYAAWKRGW